MRQDLWDMLRPKTLEAGSLFLLFFGLIAMRLLRGVGRTGDKAAMERTAFEKRPVLMFNR